MPEQKRVTANSTQASVATVLTCGARFEPPPSGGLAVTGHFPTSVSAGERVISGAVDIRSEKAALQGTMSPHPDVFLVQAGRIVTTPQPKDAVGMDLDLAVGQVESLPGRGTLAPCDPGGDATGDRRLAPGTYELYALVAVHRDDGSTVEGVGGPWALEVR